MTPPPPHEERAESLVAPGFATVVVLAALMVGAALVYGPLFGFVYAEFSDYALLFGNHPWYEPLGLGDILEKYVTWSEGWYRPTSIYVVPYALRLDFFEPAGILAANIAFFVVASVSVGLLVRRAPAAGLFLAGTMILFAPALYLVPYGVTIDSLYVLCSVIFVAAVVRSQGRIDDRERLVLRVVAIVAFFLAATSKEIAAALLSFLLVPVLLLAESELTLAAVKRALRVASPYIAVSIAFVILFSLERPPTADGDVYDSSPTLDKVPGALSLVLWTFGFRSPLERNSHWIPPWGTGELLIALLTVVVLAASVAIGWRRLGGWRIALFTLTFVGLAVGIALPGGLPHHAFPLVVLVAAGALAASGAAYATLRARSGALATVYLVVLVLVGVGKVAQAHGTYGGVLYKGPQAPFLDASTELFDGSTLTPVRTAENPLFVFEDCLQGLHNPLRYFARAGDGEEVVVPDFEASAFTTRFEEAARSGREAFVAECTGTADPWYRLFRYDARRERLVPAAP